MTNEAAQCKGGLHITPLMIKMGMVLTGIGLAGVVALQLPAIRRYTNMETM